MRYVLALILAAVLAFCVFGFLACFEPMADPGHLLKAIYAITGLSSLLGIVYLVLPSRPKTDKFD